MRSSVASAIVLRELGVRSLQAHWWQAVVGFWNMLAEAPAGSLHNDVALSDLHDAIVHNVHNWAWSVFEGLRELGYAMPVNRHHMARIDLEQVLALFDACEQRCWRGLAADPRTCPTDGAHLCKYANWFAGHPHRRNPFVSLPLGLSTVRAVLQFRIGCHALPVVAQQHQGMARHDRLCQQCALGALGDEQHMLFECPATQPVRQAFAHLFAGRPADVRSFMWQPDTAGVAKCVLACLRAAVPN